MQAGRDTDVQEFLDAHPFSPFQWVIFALCFTIVLLDGFDTAAIGYIAPSLIAEWGVSRPALAPVLSAALFGLAAGALAAGPLADRFGRKAVLTGSVLVFGIACLMSGYAGSLDTLVVWRFLTGLGLGAAMPNAVTLMSEFCPRGRRATIVNAMFCGFPLGAAFGGFLAAWLLLLLPESVRYMLAKGAPAERVRAVLSRISASASQTGRFVNLEAQQVEAGKGGIATILSPRFLVGTVMLWIAYFMGLVIFYALVNWMPVLFGDAGMRPATAAMISALFPLGGIGAVFFGWLMDRFNGNSIIAIGFLLTALAIAAIGQATGNPPLLILAVLVAGTLMNTAQSSLPALAAGFYPTQGRATGVAWMLGLGRFGGIAGSFLVAELSRYQLSLGSLFLVLAVPGLVAAAALTVKRLAHPMALPAAEAGKGVALGH